MTNHGPWSVKGIDQRAREAAREAAREEGLTIGEYINRMLLEETQDDAPSVRDLRSPRYPRPVDNRYDAGPETSSPASGTFDKLIARLEAVEARSTLALTGIDQSIVGLVTRLNRTDSKTNDVAEDVKVTLEDLRATHEALQGKVAALEDDESGARNLEALKSLEQALGKLASHIYEESNRQKDDTAAVRGRVETGLEDLGDRVAGMERSIDTTLSDAAQRVEKKVEQAELRAEGTAKHLSERFSELETNVSSKLSRIDNYNQRIDAVEGDVAGALTSIESVMTRMQERLHLAETTTNAALSGLEQTFESLDQRIEEIAKKASPEAAEELRAQFESRFDGLANDLRSSIEATRSDLAREIEQAAAAGASPDALKAIEESIDTLKSRVSTGEERSSRALESMTEQVGRISSSFDKRLRDVEAVDMSEAVSAVREDVTALSNEVSERFEQFGAQNDEVIDRITSQMKSLADQFDSRVEDSEKRSASAIEQVGEQVANVAQRLQARQERSFAELRDNLDAQRKQQNLRLSDALTGVSNRIEEMQRQSTSALSPVQRAIASLATRLESLEDFTSPPHAEPERHEPPHFDAAEIEDIRDEPSQASGLSFLTDEDEDFGPDFSAETDHEEPADDFENLTFADDEEEAASLLSADDDDFEAGLPELSDLDDEPVVEAQADDSFEYETDLLEEPAADDENDPLSALVDWDDGRDETRDSDIFGDDDPAAASSELAPEDDVDGDMAAFDDAPGEAEASGEAEFEVPLEDDTEPADYLSRARQAAMNATAASGHRGAASLAGPKTRKSNKLPLVAAVSVIALATAAAGTMITLRGLQDDPEQPVVQTSSLEVINPAPINSVPETDVPATGETPEADAPIEPLGADEFAPVLSESEAAEIEEQLFDAVSDLTATPDAAEVEAPPAAPPAPNFANLPQIPQTPTTETAAANGDPVAQLILGEKRLDAGDYTSGPSLVRKAADQGQPAAQYRLAKLHERGLGVPRDLEAARQLTESAAQGGNVKAMHDLAVYYAEGEGGPQSYAAAAEWFRKAADYGLTDSQYNLAVLYEAGLGISPSQSEALYWYEVAARQGDDGAPEKVTELRTNLSLEVAQQAQRRAASWTAAEPAAAPNGRFSAQPWQATSQAQVSAIQTVLAALGYEPGPADGIMGSGTVSAIQAYQTDSGLEPTGAVSPALVDSLNEMVASAGRTG